MVVAHGRLYVLPLLVIVTILNLNGLSVHWVMCGTTPVMTPVTLQSSMCYHHV
jgi:hypothetical protein